MMIVLLVVVVVVVSIAGDEMPLFYRVTLAQASVIREAIPVSTAPQVIGSWLIRV